MYLEKIDSPADVKKLSPDELVSLAAEARHALLEKLSAHGGHIGPNLGMVEATVALHAVFDSPKDKIVYDVSHQSYVHKMLTGRRDAFLDPAKYDDVSGYSEPSESEHDFFIIGHTSTSVSLACGLAKARDLTSRSGNVIAVIGDGSLSGGEAFEGLDNAAELGTNFIVIFNDNQMSIAENHGGLYRSLQKLRETNGQASDNFFRAMGFDYLYVNDGNNVKALTAAFRKVKDTDHPVVVHINTLKGKGYSPAEKDKENFHWGFPFDLRTGKSKAHFDGEDYGNLTAEFLLDAMRKDPAVVAVSSATPTVMGFTVERRQQAGKQFVDVGIAEEHAVALISGMAKNGAHPVYGVYGTFLQRAYDQISQDLCINSSPATILVFWGSLGAMNDVTHLGFFDIPLLANIPNLVYLAPTSREEYFAMLRWSMAQNSHPVAIRVPTNGVISDNRPVPSNYDDLNRYEITRKGKDVAVLGLGSFHQLGEAALAKLEAQTGITGTLINPRYISGVDANLLESLRRDHRLVITLEDGVLNGGFGEKIARHYGLSDMKIRCYGAPKEFRDRFDIRAFYEENHLTPDLIAEDIAGLLKNQPL